VRVDRQREEGEFAIFVVPLPVSAVVHLYM